jgi:hypothetical protein
VLIALLVQVDPLTGPPLVHGGVFADAVEAVGSLGSAARRRLGVVGVVSAWQAAAGVTGGLMLSPARAWEPINTN